MADWSAGYNTSTPYVYGYYRDLAPSYLQTICTLQGVANPEGPLTYLELGCGQGLGPTLLAASNPNDTFIGVDFAPEHILGARRLASAANLTNVTFMEESFGHLAEDRTILPQCDIIALHGIYSWISEEQRAAVRIIIQAHLKNGGLLYISYNCAAGWGPIGSFRRLLQDMTLSRGGGLAQTSEALQRLKVMRDAEFGFFKNSAPLSRALDDVMKQDRNYIEHEYLNDSWQLFHFQDVAHDMQKCKLSFVGSTSPADNSEALNFRPELAKLIKTEPSPVIRESMKDYHCNRRFRKDLFIRGALSLTTAQRYTTLADQHFALLKPRAEINMTANIPGGQLRLGKAIYEQAFALLEKGPANFKSLAGNLSELHDLVTILLHIGAIHPVSQREVSNAASARLNHLTTSSLTNLSRYTYMSSTLLGSAVRIDRYLAPAFAAYLHQKLNDENMNEEFARMRNDEQLAPFWASAPLSNHNCKDELQSLKNHLNIWKHLGIFV